MSAADLHTLTGAYALDALSEREAAQFSRHLAACRSCAQEVGELRETAARLALAVAVVPPAELRGRVMGALPGVRQLPPGPHATAGPSGGGWRRRLPQLAAAACLVAALAAGAVAVDAEHRADRQRDRTAQAEQQAAELGALLAAPDATTHAGAVRGGGSATVVSSRQLGRTAFLYRGLPRLDGSHVYQLWYSRGGAMVPAGLVDPGSPDGAALLAGSARGASGVGVTVEPQGGSRTPTGTPVVLLTL
ncbi:anti-sigma factor [Streptomyces sp. NBC_01198]|uniref:anti-sigma factor n=1 Tax=Streptomyces sp. NBC_01198 TaxID=2903769 RepID=UPI002E138A02|nr:anti-sigma factor [Streptomyces sp. NBC_01198]